MENGTTGVLKPNLLRDFCWFCSGGNTDILRYCPRSEHIKYAGIGATVFFTGLLAGISGAYAFFTVFKSVPLALMLGILWGAIIFNLDRFIVSTIKKEGSVRRQLVIALPRFLLAVLLATVISKPLELRIFESEIAEIQDRQKNEKLDLVDRKFQEKIAEKETAIDRLNQEIKTSFEIREQNYQDYKCECDGTCGTGKVGRGSECERKEKKYLQSDREYQELKTDREGQIARIRDEIEALKNENEGALTNASDLFSDGLVARISAAGRLPWGPGFFIMLLILMIEVSPILAKILSPRGPYDEMLRRVEDQFYLDQLEAVNERKMEISKKTTLLSNLHQAQIEQEVYQKKAAMRAVADAHMELIREQIDEWLKAEKERLDKRKLK
ncbi:MAG: DUF4407 domain-containing protein [Lewinellaceae bacterium]|nr:DUF4407 domain-containing protein [Lewinella sp.]MCB9278176.1 DUF4407 domain-containing protein [Lewinellaceae bacterium]